MLDVVGKTTEALPAKEVGQEEAPSLIGMIHKGRKEMQGALDPSLKMQSTRQYKVSPVIADEIRSTKIIFGKPIVPGSKVCLIGDGQGADTEEFLKMGVKAENISSINYEASEVEAANASILRGTGIMMRQGDAIDIQSLRKAGIEDESQDVVTLMHVLETPVVKGDAEKQLVKNLARILKQNGELLVSQYKRKLTAKEAEAFGVEEIKAETIRNRYGEQNWRERFREEYGVDWVAGMRYSEISNIRSKEELQMLFGSRFDIKIDETESEYILKMRKR